MDANIFLLNISLKIKILNFFKIFASIMLIKINDGEILFR